MYKNKKLTSDFSRKVSTAARLTIDDINNGRAQQEPAVTDRFIAYLQGEIRRSRRSKFQWSAMTLTDRGRNSQEKKYGADFVGCLEINLPNFSVKKGFLAQAKKIEPGQSFSATEYANLVKQCKDMLRLSPASFVFLYSVIDGFSVIPAISVVSAQRCNPHEITNKPVQKYFTEHFDCFIGDQVISLAKIKTLDQLYERYKARTAFQISIGVEEQQRELRYE